MEFSMQFFKIKKNVEQDKKNVKNVKTWQE